MPTHPQGHGHKRLVIGLTGRIGAGKTSAGKYLSSKYNFQYHRYSQVLSEWLAKDPDSKTSLQEVGWNVMSGGMQTELNKRLIDQIQPAPVDVAIDGLRHHTDYEFMRKSFGSSFHLIYIESHRETRWNHLKNRGKYASFDVFERADSHAVEQEIEKLRECAALVIHNESSLEKFHIGLDKLVQEFQR